MDGPCHSSRARVEAEWEKTRQRFVSRTHEKRRPHSGRAACNLIIASLALRTQEREAQRKEEQEKRKDDRAAKAALKKDQMRAQAKDKVPSACTPGAGGKTRCHTWGRAAGEPQGESVERLLRPAEGAGVGPA